MTFNPDYAVSPGETIKELLYDEFAKSVELSIYDATDLIEGRHEIDKPLAAKLGVRFNITKQFWLNLENNYRDKLKELGIKAENESIIPRKE